MASNLAPVYLDDTRVTLQGDPRPQVAKILQAGGKAASEGTTVVRLLEASGADGQPLGLSEVIDREKAITPVYLRVVKAAKTVAGSTKGSGKTLTPGDITRGTEAVSPSSGRSGEQAARSGTPQAFSESQSFGDPVHKAGSPRVAQGARPSREAPAHDDAAARPGSDDDLSPQETANEIAKASEEEEE